jgi:probable rRNA maturation factor
MADRRTARVSASRTEPPLTLELTVATRRHWTPARGSLLRWVGVALPKASQLPVVVSIYIVGASRSRMLNRRYRGRDRPTNILSFAGAGCGPDRALRLGELVFCAPLIAREAREQAKSLAAHWAHLTVHGVLHLRGFSHERAHEAVKMESREIQLLEKLGFSDPYA